MSVVDRCVCCDLPFATMLAVARREGLLSLEEVRARLELGTGCGLCLPYAAEALASGCGSVPLMPAAAGDIG